MNKKEGGRGGGGRGGEVWWEGGQGQPGRGVLTVSQGVASISLQAEILEHSGQLTATVDLGLAGGEQTAEQRGQGQQYDPGWARLPSGSPAPGFHAGGRCEAPPRWLTAGLWNGRQLNSPGRPLTEGYPLEEEGKQGQGSGERLQPCQPAPLQA